MWCVCQNKASGELTIMLRQERENSNSALIDSGITIPTLVVMVKDTKEEAEQYVKNVISGDEIIEKLKL